MFSVYLTEKQIVILRLRLPNFWSESNLQEHMIFDFQARDGCFTYYVDLSSSRRTMPPPLTINARFLSRTPILIISILRLGKTNQVMANILDNKLREDLERLKKIRAHRGLRHYWGLRVRGQHTKTTGRRGRTVGVSKKK